MEFKEACKRIYEISPKVNPNTPLGSEIQRMAYLCKKTEASEKKWSFRKKEKTIKRGITSIFSVSQLVISSLLTAFSITIAYILQKPIDLFIIWLLVNAFSYPPFEEWESLYGKEFFPIAFYVLEIIIYVIFLLITIEVMIKINKRISKISATDSMETLLYLYETSNKRSRSEK